MYGMALIVRRDIGLALRGGSDGAMVVVFFVLAAILFPFGIGPETALLARIGGGIIWVVALLAAMLGLERMFAADYEDGSLEQFALSPLPLGMVALAKIAAHWLTTGVPLIAAAPLLGIVYHLPAEAYAPLMLSLLLGTPVLSLVGSIGAALTLGARRGGVLIALLVLPLTIPLLIFGAAAVDAAIAGEASAPAPALTILAGFLIGALALAPWATVAALRQAID
jgi:heme exporter protein B